MLSLTVISANQGETYYTAENYYTSEENQAHSGWWGLGAKSLGRRNGQEFEVVGLEEGQVMIRWGRGEMGCFESSELAHLDYALVSTTYAAQGKSAKRVIGALDRYVGRESFYVAVSRVKRELRLYASEDLNRLIERVERSRAKENPGEVTGISSGRSQSADLLLPTNLDNLVAMASQQANLSHTMHDSRSNRQGRGFER